MNTQTTIILIDGIGNHQAGWSDISALQKDLDAASIRFIEFHYEDIFDYVWKRRLASKLLSWSAAVAVSYAGTPSLAPVSAKTMTVVEDTLGDIFSYFNRTIRQQIQTRLSRLLERFPSAMIFGHSLGSIVAYETLKNHLPAQQNFNLVTLGSPLGSPLVERLVKKMLDVPDKKRPKIQGWYNFYSRSDLLSGKIEGLGCYPTDQYELKTFHPFDTYVRQAFRLLQEKRVLPENYRDSNGRE